MNFTQILVSVYIYYNSELIIDQSTFELRFNHFMNDVTE